MTLRGRGAAALVVTLDEANPRRSNLALGVERALGRGPISEPELPSETPRGGRAMSNAYDYAFKTIDGEAAGRSPPFKDKVRAGW